MIPNRKTATSVCTFFTSIRLSEQATPAAIRGLLAFEYDARSRKAQRPI